MALFAALTMSITAPGATENPDNRPDRPSAATALTRGDKLVVPDHELIRCIGHGGYGEVWLARNVMGSYRAVKIVSRQDFDHDRPFDREFAGIQKFEPVSRTHLGFVHILHMGRCEDGGCFYYVMELGDDLISGSQIDPAGYQPKTLASLLKLQGRLPVSQCLDLALKLTDALKHLHQHGLCHRDIKPANIILVNNVPKLADIGLVTSIGAGRSYVGTEGFIPPEGPGAPAADIYGLGMVLYEISTGLDRREFPSLPANFETFDDAAQFAELNEVILRACQGELAKRYTSAQAMLADLTVLQNGQSVRRLHALERRWRLFKRAALMAVGLLIILGVVLYPVYLRVTVAREQRQRQIGSQVSRGLNAMAHGHLTESLADFAQALRLTQGMGDQEMNQRLRCATVLAHCPRLTHLLHLSAPARHVEFSADGRFLLLTIGREKAVLYDIAQERFTKPEFQLAGGVEAASLSPDGQQVIAAGALGEVKLWETATGLERQRWMHPDKVYAVRFNRSGSRVVTACADRKARLWDGASRTLSAELNGHTDAVLHAAFSPDDRWIITCGRDRTARLWEASTGQPAGVVLSHPSWVYSAEFSPDSRYVVTAGFDRKVRVWETASGRLITPAMQHGDGVTSAAFSPDGRWLVTASLDATVRWWESDSQLPCAQNAILRHGSRVWQAAFDADGHRIVSTCNDGTVRIWELAGIGLIPRKLRDDFSQDGTRAVFLGDPSQPFESGVQSILVPPPEPGGTPFTNVFSKDGRWLAVATAKPDGDCQALLLDVESGKAISNPIRLPCMPSILAVSSPGRMLAAICATNLVWRSFNSDLNRSFELKPADQIKACDFSLDGRQLLVQTLVRVERYDSISGQLLAPVVTNALPITHAEFSPKGERLVVCGANQQISEAAAVVWDLRAGRRLGVPMQHADGILWAAFSPDGLRIVTASEDFTARVWEAETGRPLTPPMRHEDQVQCARFSADGRWIITASTDKTARLWDAATGEPLTPPLVHPSALWHARIFKDAFRLAAGIDRNRTWFWQLPSETRSPEYFINLAGLLLGQMPGTSGWEVPAPMDHGRQLADLHHRMKVKFPASFAVTTDELERWHLAQADRFEGLQNWRGTVFHLERAARISTNSFMVARRLEQAKAKLRTDRDSNSE